MKSAIKNSATDTELIKGLKNGSKGAFTDLYTRYSRPVYNQIYKMTGNKSTAEDIIQETFAQLWQQPDNITHSTNIAGLLYTMARYKARHAIRQHKFREQYLHNLAVSSVHLHISPADTIDNKRALQLMDIEIHKLPAKMQQVFMLSRKENHSNKEIALQLGISEKTVKTQIHNALKVLKSKFSEFAA